MRAGSWFARGILSSLLHSLAAGIALVGLLTGCDGDYDRRLALVSEEAHIRQTQKGMQAVLEITEGGELALAALPKEVVLSGDVEAAEGPPTWIDGWIVRRTAEAAAVPETAKVTLVLTLLVEVPTEEVQPVSKDVYDTRAGYSSSRPPSFQAQLDTHNTVPRTDAEIQQMTRGEREGYLFRLGMKSSSLREDGGLVYYCGTGTNKVVMTCDDTGRVSGSLWRKTPAHEQDWLVTMSESGKEVMSPDRVEVLVRYLAEFKGWGEQ